jgi:hypothetical protein
MITLETLQAKRAAALKVQAAIYLVVQALPVISPTYDLACNAWFLAMDATNAASEDLAVYHLASLAQVS